MEVPSRQPGGLPAPQGLYDGRNEHDACGIGFLADVQGRRSHDILRDGVRLLNALAHRAAVGADPRTGDGAGILIQLPHRFFAEVATEHGFWLPEEGEYGVGMFFFPQNGAHRLIAERVVERVFTEMGMRQIGWRAPEWRPGRSPEEHRSRCR